MARSKSVSEQKDAKDKRLTKKNSPGRVGNNLLNKDPKNKRRQRDTEEVKNRLKELGFDPLEFVTKVAKGEALTTNHPFLAVTQGRLKQWIQRIDNELPIETEEIEEHLNHAEKSLTDSWTPIDMRNRNALELIKYIFPQLKSQDMSLVRTGIKTGEVTKLTKAEANDFKKWFGEKF